jgi:hypothetical protein
LNTEKRIKMKNILLTLGFLSLTFWVQGQTSPTFSIRGNVQCEGGAPLRGVELWLKDGTRLLDTVFTDANGDFSFDQVTVGDYTVEATYNDGNPLNGISTFDMVLMQQHLLGRRALPAPQIMASDINRSGQLSTLDIVMLRALILAASQANQVPRPDWIFYQEDPAGATDFGSISLMIEAEDITLSLKGIKRGDLNNSNTSCP